MIFGKKTNILAESRLNSFTRGNNKSGKNASKLVKARGTARRKKRMGGGRFLSHGQ